MEVLNQIFEEGPRENLPDVRNYPSRIQLSPVPLPVTVTHVCRRWRDIATDNPFLWATIRIDSSKSSKLAELYLERSKARELEIAAVIRDAASPASFGAVLPHLHKCRDLILSFTGYAPAFATFHALMHANVPALRACEILVETDTMYEPGQSTHLFAGAPLLSSVKLDGISALGCRIPFKFLTKLELKLSHFGRKLFLWQFASILQEASPILEYLTLEGIIIDFHPDHDLTPIQLPALTTLELRLPFAHDGPLEWDDGDYVYNLFADEQFHDTMAAVMWQRESAGTVGIRHLSLDAIGLRSGIGDLAVACPNVIELAMRGLVVQPVLSLLSNTTIPDVRTSDSSNPLNSNIEFPYLQSLSVSTSNDKLLRAAVLTRKAAAAPIATLRLCGKRSWSEHTLQWFRQRVDIVSTHDGWGAL